MSRLHAINEMALDMYVSTLYDPRLMNPNNRYSKPIVKPYSPTTIKNHIVAIKAFFAWLRKKRYIDRNPAEVLEKPVIPKGGIKPISQQHLDKLLSVSAGRDLMIISMLAYAGLRVGELCSLSADSIDLENRVIHVVGKGL